MLRLICAFAACAVVLGNSCTSNDGGRSNRPKREARYDGPVIDIHAHLVTSGLPDEIDNYRKNAGDPRLQKITAIVVAPLGKMDETRALNDKALALAKENGKIVPVPSVHPYDGGGAIDELNRVADAGATMLKLDASLQGFDLADPRVASVFQRCGERGLTILLHGTDSSTFSKVLALAAKHPQTQVIIAHMGFTDFDDAAVFGLMTKFPWYADNVWFDLSLTAPFFVNSPYEEQLAWVIRRFPKKVMFGSDFPVYTSSAGIDAVQTLGLSEGEQADVLYGNAARLLKLTNG